MERSAMKYLNRPGIVLCLGLLLSPAPAYAGAVTGTLKLPAARSRVRLASSGQPSTHAANDPQAEAVVYIDRIPDKVEEKLAKKAGKAVMGQCYGAFVPRMMVVAAGTTLTFENQDRVYHNAFSVSPVRKFDIGKYAPRETRDVVFKKPGLVKVFCELDPDELGFIYVTPNNAFVRPDADGQFKLPKLPPGNYTVTAWHPQLGSVSRELVMEKRGDVTVALELPSGRKPKAR